MSRSKKYGLLILAILFMLFMWRVCNRWVVVDIKESSKLLEVDFLDSHDEFLSVNGDTFYAKGTMGGECYYDEANHLEIS